MADIQQEVLQLREQGLPDGIIKGFNPQEVDSVLMQEPEMPPVQPSFSSPAPDPQGNIYERIEQIAESMIDEKWDDLIGEVKKIVQWKDQLEERQVRIESDITKLKEDFKMLHGAVLGKLEQYDDRMRDVGTELNAVGKVFKEVVPSFVENVK